MTRASIFRATIFFVAGMALVLLIEDDFQRLSQLAEMFAIDYVFLAIWGGLFGAVLWGLFHLASLLSRSVVRALRSLRLT